ncbi:hypothetical protein [Nonlabens agnitus]|uniref:Sulfatase-modifying factor enzyme domain-containing protein n=1 Tax=Nonlabens agnitus TaxID=870484 RepID=A0A2S9WW58_9FLAO|nr:hypothetical protein [Nonlabens agnitus]PRP67606.1 hypothetical protein BST86_11130 [Nonlabens agnitus]
MKKALLLLIIFSNLSMGQMEFLTNMPDELTNIPPGTIRINDSLFIDKSPVTHSMYLEMIETIKKGWNYDLILKRDSLSMEEIIDIPMDTLKSEVFLNLVYPEDWFYQDLQKQDYSKYYYRDVEYSRNPVTMATQQQARLFCSWRTNMLYLLQKNDSRYSELPYSKFNYFLSTSEVLKVAKEQFTESKKLKIIDKGPLDVEGLKLRKYYDRGKFILFSDRKFLELTQSSSESETGIFRCMCAVK